MFPIPFNFPFRKKDGSITTMDDAISSGGGSYTLPTASASVKGGVKIGEGLTMDGETLKNNNPTPFSLPTASAETLGGVKVGDGLTIEDGVLSASGGSSGVKLYYKEYDMDNAFTFANVTDTPFYQYVAYTGAANAYINGYTAVGVRVPQAVSNTNYFYLSEVRQIDSEQKVYPTIFTTYNTNMTSGWHHKFRIYYVKNSDLEQLT